MIICGDSQGKALPILIKFKAWLDEASDKVLARSYIGKAIKYNLNQWSKLVRYIEDGHLGIIIISPSEISDRLLRVEKIGCSQN